MPPKGHKHSPESILKMSKSHIGKVSPMKGKHHTERAKTILSKNHKGKNLSAETEFKKGHIPWNRGIYKHYYFFDLCWCGCGELVYDGNKFKHGHNTKINHNSNNPETRKKQSIARIGNCYAENHVPSNETRKLWSLKRKGKQLGENHPNWNGGTSFLPYCSKFNNHLKESVRIRDDYTCQLCGTIQNGRKHSIHHIHHDKENCYPDLITLCCSCNSKVNSDRKYYEKLFMSNLNERQLLFWTRKYAKPI